MKQKGIAPILIILLIAAAIGGYLVYTNYSNLSRVKSRDNRTKVTPPPSTQITPLPSSTPDATVNWKTYINTKYNFSLKYPPNWKLDSSILDSSILVEGGIPIGQENKYPQRVDLRNITGDQDFSTIGIDPEGYGSCINPEMKSSKTQFNGINVTENLFTNNIGHKVYCYTGFDLERLPKFSFSVSYPEKDSVIVNQILSTFRFN